MSDATAALSASRPSILGNKYVPPDGPRVCSAISVTLACANPASRYGFPIRVNPLIWVLSLCSTSPCAAWRNNSLTLPA